MDSKELEIILGKHRKWLLGTLGGQRADLQCAYLQRADLRGADLRGADLRDADLRDANLQGANLQGAYLQCADLQGANLPYTEVAPKKGKFILYKKGSDQKHIEYLITLEIPTKAKRLNAYSSRKIRVERAKVLKVKRIDGKKIDKDAIIQGKTKQGIKYIVGKIVKPDKFDTDPRFECSSGIHGFITEREAIEW